MSAILHISDLHFIGKYSDNESRQSEGYQQGFFNALKDLKYQGDPIKIKYVIVSGDLSDGGYYEQFNRAEVFLNELVKEFGLEKSNFLICPGNHDISWYKLEALIDDPTHLTKEPYEYHDIKFQNFKTFYERFFETKKFDPEKAVVDVIRNEDDRVLIVGLNSCFKESFLKKDHIGFIDFASIKTKIDEYENELDQFNRLIVMHHNPVAFEKEAESIDNWNAISELLKEYPTIVNGHIHSSNGESIITSQQKYYVSVGSFAKKSSDIKNAFNILLADIEDTSKYNVLYYEYEPTATPYWEYHGNKNAIKEISLSTKRGIPVLKNIPKPHELLEFTKPIKSERTTLVIEHQDKSYSDLLNDLVKIIEDYKLFKSGHFHWSPKFRSHGIIDINYLISNKISLDLITQLYYLKIKEIQNEIGILPDLLVAIGIAGNVIGARLSVMFPDCNFSFVPDELKHEFSHFEKTIRKGDYKNILIIKDIIYIADTLEEFFEHNTFKKIDTINVLSLFYCGKKDSFGVVFEKKKNVWLKSICDKIIIERCPHSGDVKECSIVKYDLDTYYELYTLEK